MCCSALPSPLGVSSIRLAFALAAIAVSAKGEEAAKPDTDPAILTLERIYSEEEFKTKKFAAQWIEGTSSYTYLKGSDDEDEKKSEGKSIWRNTPGEPEPQVMVEAAHLVPPGATQALTIDAYTFSKDLSRLLIYTNSKRVWRKKSRGDYWLLDRTSHELRKLGGDAPPSSLMFANFSPEGRHVAYVKDRNIYVEDIIDGSIKCLTTTKSEDIINGTADWVYEEELGLRDGIRWSPDSRSIAYWQFDTSSVRKHTMVDNVSGLYPKLHSFAYPKVGQTNAACRVGVVQIESGKTTWMKIDDDPRAHYIARMDWREGSNEVVLQQLNRAQNTNSIIVGSADGGNTHSIFTETDDAWLDVHDALHWVRDGSHFTWLSERDGWRHLYLVSADGSEVSCLTPGEFDVIDLLSVDEGDKWVYFTASPSDPASRYLYRVRLDGSDLTRLTPADEKRGTHSYRISPNGKYAIVVSSTADTPPVTKLVDLPVHQTLDVLESNEKLVEKIDALALTPAEFFYVDIGTEHPLHARCIKPPNFDPSKKYPLLIYVYGEPAGQVVTDRWSSSLWHAMLAQQGYVVMSFDNRGSASPRGRAWRKAVYRQVGIMAPEDQANAVRKVLAERPYLDPERVGIWGWSGGGSMSLNAIFKYPDVYSAAIAVASVPNQRHYDTIYQERYMGLPEENVEGYHQGSPINFAQQLEGDLLIVHGAADDNCHYQTYEKLVDTLIRHNKPFSMMTYPRGTHSIKEGKNTTLHLRSLMTRFLHEKLPVTTPGN